jgi:Mrp family chromosome partitioning ATPase
MTAGSVPGRSFTFYSYKGGTGRSMVVANVAWLLASSGARVLLVDWDLEAPGLHRYLHPFLVDPELSATDGIIDFVSTDVSRVQVPACQVSPRRRPGCNSGQVAGTAH